MRCARFGGGAGRGTLAGLNGPARPLLLTQTSVDTPPASIVATYRRVGTPPWPATQQTSVQTSPRPANGAAATWVQFTAGTVVRANRPALVAATSEVASAGSAARR